MFDLKIITKSSSLIQRVGSQIYPINQKGKINNPCKTSIFLTEKGLLHYIRKSNMPEAEKISRDIENLVIDIRKGDL